MKKIKVGVIGHTGHIGMSLVKRLEKHPFAEVVYKKRSKGEWGNLADAKVVFLALRYGQGIEYLPRLAGKKIIDSSLDNRGRAGWVCGLSEVYRDKILGAEKVAGTGCWAMSVLLGIRPLKGRIKEMFITGTSAISGAGKDVSKEDNFEIYDEGMEHLQIIEIERELDLQNIIFIPERIYTAYLGMITKIYAKIDSSVSLSELYDLYDAFYAESPFIRLIKDPRARIETKNVNNTNFCDIKILKFGNKVVVISALDNLTGKGGAGQAVQNFNLMCGFPETTGLV